MLLCDKSTRSKGLNMPVIRISDSTWDRLKRWAEPLEDSADDAIRRVLDAAEKDPVLGKAPLSSSHKRGASDRIANSGRDLERLRKSSGGPCWRHCTSQVVALLPTTCWR